MYPFSSFVKVWRNDRIVIPLLALTVVMLFIWAAASFIHDHPNLVPVGANHGVWKTGK